MATNGVMATSQQPAHLTINWTAAGVNAGGIRMETGRRHRMVERFREQRCALARDALSYLRRHIRAAVGLAHRGRASRTALLAENNRCCAIAITGLYGSDGGELVLAGSFWLVSAGLDRFLATAQTSTTARFISWYPAAVNSSTPR